MDELDKHFIQWLSHNARLRYRLKTRPTERPSYAIMLECKFDGEWQQVVRADDWDGGPHLDIHSPNQASPRKEWLYDSGDNKLNCKQARQWMLDNWELQRNRYERERNQPLN